jgi:hypothetical protein
MVYVNIRCRRRNRIQTIISIHRRGRSSSQLSIIHVRTGQRRVEQPNRSRCSSNRRLYSGWSGISGANTWFPIWSRLVDYGEADRSLHVEPLSETTTERDAAVTLRTLKMLLWQWSCCNCRNVWTRWARDIFIRVYLRQFPLKLT